ncbi:MAG: hypothetical protein ACE366_16730 [Bradymonadia bacterium]
MSIATQHFKVGEARPTVKARLTTGNDETPIVLADATLKFHYMPEDGDPAADIEIVEDGDITRIDADQADVEALLPADFTNAPGKYRGEFEVTYPDGRTRVHPRKGFIPLEVRARMN